MPEVPGPEGCRRSASAWRAIFGPLDDDFFRRRPVDLRHVTPLTWEAARDPC